MDILEGVVTPDPAQLSSLHYSTTLTINGQAMFRTTQHL